MPASDAIPGWGLAPDEGSAPAQATIPDRLSDTWTIYRTRLRALLELSLPIQGPLGLVYAPSSVVVALAVEQQWGQQGLLTSGDPAALRQLLAAYLPGDLPSVIGRSLAPAAGILGVILLTVAFALLLLESTAESGLPARPSLRLVLDRSSAFVLPVAVAALAGACVNLLESRWITSLTSFVASDPGSAVALTGPLLALDGLIFVLAIAAIYAVGRWTLAIPVAAIEQVGLRRALARSSELSRGHRLQVLLSLAVVSFATGIATFIAVFGATWITGALWGTSSALGFALCLVTFVAVLVLTAPLIPILIVVLYRDLRDAPVGIRVRS